MRGKEREERRSKEVAGAEDGETLEAKGKEELRERRRERSRNRREEEGGGVLSGNLLLVSSLPLKRRWEMRALLLFHLPADLLLLLLFYTPAHSPLYLLPSSPPSSLTSHPPPLFHSLSLLFFVSFSFIFTSSSSSPSHLVLPPPPLFSPLHLLWPFCCQPKCHLACFLLLRCCIPSHSASASSHHLAPPRPTSRLP